MKMKSVVSAYPVAEDKATLRAVRTASREMSLALLNLGLNSNRTASRVALKDPLKLNKKAEAFRKSGARLLKLGQKFYKLADNINRAL